MSAMAGRGFYANNDLHERNRIDPLSFKNQRQVYNQFISKKLPVRQLLWLAI